MIKPMVKLAKRMGYTVTYCIYDGDDSFFCREESRIIIREDHKNRPYWVSWHIAWGIAHLELPPEYAKSIKTDYAYELLERLLYRLLGGKRPKVVLTGRISWNLLSKCNPDKTLSEPSNITIGKKGLMQEIKEQPKRQESLGLLTVNHVAKILNVHNRTVFRLIWSDTLKASKVGRQWRIHRDWVDEYLERQSENRSIADG